MSLPGGKSTVESIPCGEIFYVRFLSLGINVLLAVLYSAIKKYLFKSSTKGQTDHEPQQTKGEKNEVATKFKLTEKL